MNRNIFFLVLFMLMGAFLSGCATTSVSTPANEPPLKQLKDYPDHNFNPREYVKGMKREGHNLLIWRNPSTDLTKYRSIKITPFDGRLLPEQSAFSYSPFIKQFNMDLNRLLKISKNDPNGLRVEGAVVECNPGSNAARSLIGYGAGRASCAVACELYEPGVSTPVIRIYTRDTTSGTTGPWRDSSAEMMNHILVKLASRLSMRIEKTVEE